MAMNTSEPMQNCFRVLHLSVNFGTWNAGISNLFFALVKLCLTESLFHVFLYS